MNNPKFYIFVGQDTKHYFHLKAGNGEIILQSQGYSSKQACEFGIASVRTNGHLEMRYERLEAQDGSPYFNLKAGNGEIIGRSQMYSSTQAMEVGIKAVKDNAQIAPTVEE